MDRTDISGLARISEIGGAKLTHNENRSCTVSFIIPALNEEKHIPVTIGSIQSVMGQLAYDYEIIVVDNGSDDRTVAIAGDLDARTFIQPKLNISELRNFGAAKSCGSTLVFLDADVSLTSSWQSHFGDTLERIEAGEKIVTGSHCSPPDSGNLLNAFWFNSLSRDDRNTHLGSAHMIMSRLTFEEIGGFDINYSSGEDYEFCSQAKLKEFRILSNRDLTVIHHDYPKSLIEFVKREAWHGGSDFESISSWKESKVAIAASLFLALHLLIIIGCFANAEIALIAATAVVLLLFVSSAFKFRGQGIIAFFVNSGIFYFYYVGRVAALFTRLFKQMT